MHSSKPRIIDAATELAAAATVATAALTYIGAVECDGYDHIDFTVYFGALGNFGANTTLTAAWREVTRNVLAGTVDVEDVDLATGLAPNIQYQPSKTLTAGLYYYSFRVRTQGHKVALYLQTDVADSSSVRVTYVRG